MPETTPAAAPDLAVPAPAADLRRIPHLGHVLVLGALSLAGLLTSVVCIFIATHYRLFGIASIPDAMHSLPYALGTMLVLYLAMFLPGAAVFPALWRRPLLAGLQWNAAAVRRHWWKLVAVGVGCFLIALALRSVLHFPAKTPMGELLNTPAAVWTMFVFSVTIAPLCEEIVFRGFFLPAFATAWDWLGEKLTRRPQPALLANHHPRWSVPAMIFGAVPTSFLFALVHAGQNADAWGPFILLVSVSLVLCAVRLAARSVAASTLTHASYNFTLFAVMFLHTQGFHNLHN